MLSDSRYLYDLASEVAVEAGELIRKYEPFSLNIVKKDAGSSKASQIVTEVDLLAQDLILKKLLPTCRKYNLGVLTEELPDDGSRFSKEAFWAVDPLDGTLPFSEGKSGYAVSIALVDRAGRGILSAVYDPTKGNLYSALRGIGAYKNKLPLAKSELGSEITLFLDGDSLKKSSYTSFMDSIIEWADQNGYKGVVPVSGGGAVMNAISVAEAGASIYVKIPKDEQGGGCIWDFGATSLILGELGLFVSDFFGNPLNLNRSDSVYMNRYGVFITSIPRLNGYELINRD